MIISTTHKKEAKNWLFKQSPGSWTQTLLNLTKMYKLATALTVLLKYGSALNLDDGPEEDVCAKYEEVHESIRIWQDDVVIENKIFYG